MRLQAVRPVPADAGPCESAWGPGQAGGLTRHLPGTPHILAVAIDRGVDTTVALLDEVLLEYHRIGNAVRVSAIDPITGTEVTIQGPATATEQMLRRTAVAKLNYVLSRASGQGRTQPPSMR